MYDQALYTDAVLTRVLAMKVVSNVQHVDTEDIYKRPRIQILSYCLMSVEGITIAGSLPPSSRVTGVSASAAAATTYSFVSDK